MAESIFQEPVIESTRRTTDAGTVFPERSVSEAYPWTALEDYTAFHELCERLRVSLIGQLRREEAGPINRWRLGTVAVQMRARACQED